MNISAEGRDLLTKIDEVLSTEYECYRMITAFDQGNGALGLTSKELIKLIKSCEVQLDNYVNCLSMEDITEILDKIYNVNDKNIMFGIAFNVDKEKMILVRVLNELLSKFLKDEISNDRIGYGLILSQYITIDMVNVLLNVLNKMLNNFDDDMKRQIIITKYHLIFCIREIKDTLIQNNFKIMDNTFIIANTAHDFCGVKESDNKNYINRWAIETFYNALNVIKNSKAKKINIIDVVNSAIMRTVLILVDENIASELMHNTMNYLNSNKIIEFNANIIFDAITSRFEDENITQVVSFKKD